MPTIDSARERLQRSLEKLQRGSRRRSAGARGRASSAAPPAPPIGAENQRGPAFFEGASRAGPARIARGSEPAAEEPGWAEDLAADLLERLDRIEERLADLQRPLRPIPASREIFSEWVRLRKWEEMPFADFLKLRRSGLV